MTADEREGKIAETFLVSSKHNPKTKRLTERKNLTKNLQNATTKSYTAKGKNKSQKLCKLQQQSHDSLKHPKKKSSKICKTQQETHAPKERTKKGSHKCKMQQILQQPKGRKTKLTNLTKECNNKSCNPEGKKNLPSHICKMQHYDHATNQPHNPATKCNNKLMQAKGRKRTFPHKSAKCNIIIYNKSCIPKENPTHKIMQSKGKKNKNKNQPHKPCKLPEG